ncbi:MAG: hypothetical protein ACFFC3_09445, partial [Candidatus Odinarchaeota archaeon]
HFFKIGAGALAILFIFDLSRPETFDYYQMQFKKVWNQIKKDKCLMLVIGNKLDLVQKQEIIEREKYQKLVKKEGLMGYIELSSVNNINELINYLPIIIKKAFKKNIKSNF